MSHAGSETRFAILLFTDIVGSTDLKARHGVPAYGAALRTHNDHFERLARERHGIRILHNVGDGYFAEADSVTEAVRFALLFQDAMRAGPGGELSLTTRVGIHAGEVVTLATEGGSGIVAPAADLAARVMSLAVGGQILLTRFPFDEARHFLREHPAVAGRDTPPLCWLAHGPYRLKGLEEPLEIFEVGAQGLAPLTPPPDGEKARRAIRPGEEETLGWRPAIGLEIPGRPGWQLTEKLGAGGFGEVWIGEHAKLRQRRAFKFCFDDERLRALKREVTLVRLLRTALGDRDDIVRLHELKLDEPPFYLESDLAPHGNLLQWAEKQGGLAAIPLAQRIALVAHTATALAAAHSIGVLHKDIKPTNILIFEAPGGGVRPRLVDFGIGTLADSAVLAQHGITAAGFTTAAIKHSTGTPTYSPPEYLAGKPYTIQGDIFGLGVLLYQLVTAKPLDPLAVGWERDITDPLLREDIAACVDGDPARRLPSGADLADRLFHLDQRRAEITEQERLAREAAARAESESAAAAASIRAARFRKLAGAFAVLAILAIAGGVFAWVNQRKAETARAAEAAEKQNAREASLRAEHRAKEAELKALEATAVAVEASLRVGDVLSARRRLDAVRPGDRHWEWFWLDGRADSSLMTLSNSGRSGLLYDADRQRLISFNGFEVHEYDPATWKLSRTTRPSYETSAREVRPGSRGGSPFSGHQEIIGLDASVRRVAFRSRPDLPLALLDRHPAPHWVDLEVPADGLAPSSDAAMFNPDGTLLIVAYPGGGTGRGSSAERVAHVWDTSTGKIVHSLRSRAGKVMVAVFSPDGNMAATGSVAERATVREPWADTLCFWDLKTGTQLYSCLDEGMSVLDLAFSPDGKTVYAGGAFGVAIVDVPGRGPHRGKRADVAIAGERLRCLGLSSKGDVLAVGCDSGHIVLFDATSGARKQVLFGFQAGVLKLTFARRDTALAAATHDQLKVWDVTHDARRYVLPGSGAPKSAAWSLDETPVLYAFNPNFNAAGGEVGMPGGWGVAEVWDLASRKVRRLPPAASDMEALAFSAKRSVLALGRRDGVVELRRAPEGALLRQFKAHDGEVSALQFSQDGGALAVGCRDGTASVWDVDSGSSITRMSGDGVEVGHLVFADGGKLLVSATSGHHWEGKTAHQAEVTVSAMRAATWEPLWQWRSERPRTGPPIGSPEFDRPSPITIVGLVADSRRVIVQTSAGDLDVLDLVTGAARKVQADRTLGYSSTTSEQLLSLSPDNARLASIDERTRLVKILRTEDFAEMLTIAPAGGHAGGVAWSPDGNKIAVVGVGEGGQDIEIFDVLPSHLRAKLARNAASR